MRVLKPTRRETLILGGAAGALAFGLGGTPARAQPVRGGTMRVAKGHGGTTDSLDPGTFEHGFSIAMSYNIHNFLTEIREDGEVVGELAESWEASDDATAWTFRLREGVAFHDGRPVTADDVVASINHHRREGSTSAAKPLVDPIADITAPDARTVVVTLASGNADLAVFMSDYHLPVLPANDDGSADWQSGIGCGGYTLERFEPGIRADFTRNPDYWKSDRAWVDAIEMLTVIDPAARTNAMLTGEVDAIDRVETRTAPMLARAGGVSLHEVAGTQHYTFAMHCNTAPYDDVNVRLALKYGINRQELVDKILNGYGVVGNDHPIGVNQTYYNSDMEQREYDPDRAMFHLKEAGLDRLDVRLSVADAAYSGAVDAGQLYAESARAGGIDITINRAPNDGYWSNVWLKDPFCAVYWGGRPTEGWMFSTVYAEGVPWNDTFWSNARFNELLVMAQAELDPEKRRAYYYEMQEIVSNDGGAVVPMFASYLFATRATVGHGDGFAANWDMDGERWGERWWLG